MPITNPLVKEGFGRPLPEWLGELEFIKFLKTELLAKDHEPAVTMPQLAKKLKMKVQSVRSVLSTILEPDFYFVHRGVSHAMYYLRYVNTIGEFFNDECYYRSISKDEPIEMKIKKPKLIGAPKK